jgi:hypothetical protein
VKREGVQGVPRRRWVLAAGVVLASSCSRWSGDIPFASSDATLLGTKMLRPRARATVCRVHVIGRATTSSPLDAVLERLRQVDAEANGLLDLHIDVTAFSLGIFSRTCVTAVADVVRTTSVALVPVEGATHHGSHR